MIKNLDFVKIEYGKIPVAANENENLVFADIPDLMSAQISSMDKIWNSKEEDEVWSIL